MPRRSQPSQRNATKLLLRYAPFTAALFAMPNVARADSLTRVGLEAVADAIGYLAAAIAFAGVVLAAAVFAGLKAGRQDPE